MIGGLQWTEPIAARHWRWQSEELPEIKRFLWFYAKWSFLLGVPTLVAIHHFMPSELPRAGVGFLCLILLQSVGIPFAAWVGRKERIHYSVESKGLRRRDGSRAVLYSWKNIESYQIVGHPHISSIGVLELKIRCFREVRQWSFDPSQVDEQELLRAIQKHKPMHKL